MEKINELESQLNGVSNNNILKGQFEKEQENNNELQKKIESLGKQIIIDKKSKDNDSKISNQAVQSQNSRGCTTSIWPSWKQRSPNAAIRKRWCRTA